MYICLCKGISDGDLKKLLSQETGKVTVETLKAKFNLGESCGSCIESACCLIDQKNSGKKDHM